ncbi:hypothetical protein BU25DRAFT_459462 [Macroventuria anomochaeta]|uniref:Uncharacterized protein n=1 Tax=Macroventuria anomochaeta TaxID=301207 RepID=A0ACB6RYJ3_9PLEO|nr:uncharacterized protein BU25DRAFT_459462 [Macroventuria anomochaeta]KAF2626322.1 hypothetical protein BU25DRAFT_459462 [Macroventuria anomochaeta]
MPHPLYIDNCPNAWLVVIPLAISFMGWQGSGGSSVATSTINIWFGGVLLFIAGIGEFLLGNTFPMMVFAYGAYFLSYATTVVPGYNAIGYFNPDGSGAGSPVPQNQTAMFAASYAFYPVVMCILSFIFLLGSLSTNLVFVIIFIFATISFGLGAGAFFYLSRGNIVVGTRLAKGLGACFFATRVLGFYFLLELVVAIMELPISDIPVGDMSTVIKAKPRGVVKEERVWSEIWS